MAIDRAYNISKNKDHCVIVVYSEHQKNLVFENFLLIFKYNSFPEEDISEKKSPLIFHGICKNVVVFDGETC